MCGISGIWNKNNAQLSEQSLRKFNDSLIHRGPDGFGTYIDSETKLGLAHRRLSILDLSENGKQPMVDEERDLVLDYNGEIFNFIELKEELKSLGHIFKTTNDTEVVLKAFIEWGKECFNKFNGMWAMAIYNIKSKKLLICKDRFGIKPLYYLNNSSVFAFASETNAFKNLDGFNRSVNDNLLKISINNQYVLEGLGYSIYSDVFSLLPGHYIEIDISKNDVSGQKRWFNILDHIGENGLSELENIEQFRLLFSDSCNMRLRSDVPIATALSGGLDSSAVFSQINDLYKNNTTSKRSFKSQPKAFVGIFPDSPQDETKYAKQLIEFWNTEVSYIDVRKRSKNNFIDKIVQTTQHLDAFSGTPFLSILGVYNAMMEEGYKVSMDGHGVDEMLFGYRDNVQSLFYNSIKNMDKGRARNIAKVLAGMYTESARGEKLDSLNNTIDTSINLKSKAKRLLQSFIQQEEKTDEFIISNPVLNAQKIDLPPSLSDKPYDFSSFSIDERNMFDEFFKYTLPTLLRNFDKASMHSSVEIRMPFMDWRLVCFVFSLSLNDKIGEGYTKLILRKSMQDLIPDNIRLRTWKVGFGAPLMEWFDDDFKNYSKDIINSESVKNSDVWDVKEIKNIDTNKLTLKDANSLWAVVSSEMLRNN